MITSFPATCRNKRLYSLSITEEDEGFTTDEVTEEEFQLRELLPHISLDALEGIVGLNTMKGLKWKMQGLSFMAYVFIIELSDCEMVLGIQWLSFLGSILCNYKHLWMPFDWQGKKVLLKGENPPKL